MKDIVENKKVDINVFKKMMRYVKPYIHLVVISISLLLIITFIELFQTVIIGKSIDNYINGYKKPFAIVENKSNKTINFKNRIFSRDKEDINNSNLSKAQIVYLETNYYLFIGLNDIELKELNEIKKENVRIKENSVEILLDDKIYVAEKLTKEELKILREKDFRAIIYLAVVFFILICLSFTLTYLESLINQYTGQKVIFTIRKDLFNHISELSFSFFDKNPIGKIVTRITNDTENINEMYTEVLADFFKNLFLIIGIITMMLFINLKLALISFTVFPIVYALIAIYRIFAIKNYRILRKLLSDLNAFLSEKISSIKIIQILNIEDNIFKKFRELSFSSYKAHLTEIIIFAVFRPSMFMSYILTVIIVILIGGTNVINNTLSIGTLFIFIQYTSRLFDPIQELAEKFNIFQSAMVSAERIFNLFDEKSEVSIPKKPIIINKVKGNIKFNDVWFAYNNEEWVLKGISFEIKQGDTVAIVGSTGSGKTSILNVLCRYYEFQKGSITIDDVDIRELDPKSIRDRMGTVMQDVFIFNGTVKENISLNDENVNVEEVVDAAMFVNADKFIDKLKNRYDEILSEKGLTLSTGERQLLSFARAVYKKPDIFLLDEATSNIDTDTEEIIQNALKKMLTNKTSIVIAHRLSTIKNSKKILVLHHGKIVEAGTHKELLKKRGIYYRLYKIQFNEN